MGTLLPSNTRVICCQHLLGDFLIGYSQGVICGKFIPEADRLAQARCYVAWKLYLTISSKRKINDEKQTKHPSILSITDEHLDDEVKRVEEAELLWKAPGQARQPGGSPRIHLHSCT